MSTIWFQRIYSLAEKPEGFKYYGVFPSQEAAKKAAYRAWAFNNDVSYHGVLLKDGRRWKLFLKNVSL